MYFPSKSVLVTLEESRIRERHDTRNDATFIRIYIALPSLTLVVVRGGPAETQLPISVSLRFSHICVMQLGLYNIEISILRLPELQS